MADRSIVEICVSENRSIKLGSSHEEIDDLLKKAIVIAKRLQNNNWEDE